MTDEDKNPANKNFCNDPQYTHVCKVSESNSKHRPEVLRMTMSGVIGVTQPVVYWATSVNRNSVAATKQKAARKTRHHLRQYPYFSNRCPKICAETSNQVRIPLADCERRGTQRPQSQTHGNTFSTFTTRKLKQNIMLGARQCKENKSECLEYCPR